MAKNKEEIIDLEGEEWRDVHVIKGVNFFGYYQISNKGRMKALDRHYYDKLGRKGFHHGGIENGNLQQKPKERSSSTQTYEAAFVKDKKRRVVLNGCIYLNMKN